MTATPYSKYYPGQEAVPQFLTEHTSFSTESRNIYVHASTFEGISNDGSGGAIFSSLRIAIVLCKFVNCHSNIQGGAFAIFPGGELYCTQCIALGCNTKGATRNDRDGFSKGEFFYSRVKNYNSINHASEISISTCSDEFSHSCQRPLYFINGKVTAKLINASNCRVGWCSCMEIAYGIIQDCKYIKVDSCESWQVVMEFEVTAGSISYVTITKCNTLDTKESYRLITSRASNIIFEYISIINCNLAVRQLYAKFDDAQLNLNNYYIQNDISLEGVITQNKLGSQTEFVTKFFDDNEREKLINFPPDNFTILMICLIAVLIIALVAVSVLTHDRSAPETNFMTEHASENRSFGHESNEQIRRRLF